MIRTQLFRAAGLVAGLSCCGLDGPIDQPSPPPEPSAILSKREADVVMHTGVVTDVNAPTRSWTSVGDGQRRICLLSGHGILELNGKPAQVDNLVAGMTITVEAKEVDDFLIVIHGTVAPLPPESGDEAAAASPVATPAPGAAGTTTAPAPGAAGTAAPQAP